MIPVGRLVLAVVCAGCSRGDELQPDPSRFEQPVPLTPAPTVITSVAPPRTVPTVPPAPPLADLDGVDETGLRSAMESLGWRVLGVRTLRYPNGLNFILLIAKDQTDVAEVRLYQGHATTLRDSRELQGAAQGFGEMLMFTVLVRGSRSRTTSLYTQLRGAAPMRYGTGGGLSSP